MAIYVIGDIQGCYGALIELLEKLNFDEKKDTLWSTGDLVNRGPQSLEVLRFFYRLGDKHQVVLGNHDLHLLAVASGHHDVKKGDTLSDILNASDKSELLDWLRHRPLMIYDKGYTLSHAGIAPEWNVEKARALSKEVEAFIQGDKANDFFKVMYGNEPDHWDDELQGMARLRCIVNYLTRMRYCYEDGRLDLNFKGSLDQKPGHLTPWFDMPRVNKDAKIIFGHWAALGATTSLPNLYPLDSGCVWGNQLTAMRLDDESRICVSCKP